MKRYCRIGAVAAVVLVCLVGGAWAQRAATAPAQRATTQPAGAATATPVRPTASAPARRPRPAVDHVKDLFDLYTQGEERSRFFDAAGVDGELTKEEFAAAAGRPKSLVRAYDPWDAAMVCDKDSNRKLNWPEWEQYRLGVRRQVLAVADKDKDGKLLGEERDAANRYLAAGMRPPGRTAARRGEGSPGGGRNSRQRRQEMLTRYDADKDGKLSEEERKAMVKDHAERQELIRRDRNRDGRVDEQEAAAAAAERARLRGQIEQARQRQLERLQKYDTNGDGELDGEELRPMFAEMRRQRELRRYDSNNDGVLDEQETAARDAGRERMRRRAEERRQLEQELRAKHDAAKDGALSREERRAMFAEMRQVSELRRYDRNNDGVLDEQETAARDAERGRWRNMRGRMRRRRPEQRGD